MWTYTLILILQLATSPDVTRGTLTINGFASERACMEAAYVFTQIPTINSIESVKCEKGAEL